MLRKRRAAPLLGVFLAIMPWKGTIWHVMGREGSSDRDEAAKRIGVWLQSG